MKMKKSNIYLLEADQNNQRLNERLLMYVRSTAHERKQKLILLTDSCQSFEENARSISIRQLFLSLYREHKLGGKKTETFLSYDEHLVVVQLSIAAWNKAKNETLESDIHSVLKISKEILRRKMAPPHQADSGSLPTNCSKPDMLSTPTRRSSPHIQSRSGLLHSCLEISESSMTPKRCTTGSPVFSPRTPAGVSGKLHHLGSACKTPEQKLDSQTISELLEQYNQFIKKCQKVDVVDVFLKVKGFFISNINERDLFAQENLVIIEHLPRNDTEREMLTFLARDVPVNYISLNQESSGNLSWEQCCMGEQNVYLTKLPVSSIWKSFQFPTLPLAFNVTEETSVSEQFIRKLLLSYISLLVNSADELALARCLCLPDRGLSHEGFTALKHLAAKKQMSMFLTTFSFVFEIRRVKAPSESYASLFPYSKALGEFVDLADKLMMITQDIPSADLAVEKIFKTLRIALSKSKTCVLRPASVEKVCTGFLSEIHQLLQEDVLDLNVTPKPVGCGGSMRGQKVIKLLRSVLDIESTKWGQNQGTEDLIDQALSQNTPVRFPSLLSRFSSPQVVVKPLDAKSVTEHTANKATTTFSYTKSHYGWVAQDMTLKENYPPDKHESDTASDSYKPHINHKIPIVYETLEKYPKNNEPTESAADTAGSSSTSVYEESKTVIEEGQTPSAGEKVKKSKGQPLKRKKLQLEQNEKLKKVKRGGSKKKAVSISKGQRLLTNFFRTSKPAAD